MPIFCLVPVLDNLVTFTFIIVIELGVQKCRGAGVGTCFLANYSSKAKYLQGAKWRPRLSFRHLANICRSTYLLDTLFTKFWKNHIKLLHKFIGEMWKQQQHATTTYEIHFSSCFFFDLSYRPISRQNPEPSNLSPLVRQALFGFFGWILCILMWNSEWILL